MLGLHTGEQWLEPTTPLIIGAMAAFPLGFVGALLLHPEARSAPSLFLKLGVLLVVSAGVGVGIPALWSVAGVRTAVLGGAGEYVNSSAAVDDPDPGVQAAACHHMLEGQASVIDATEMLADRPALAVRCLPASDTSKAEIVAENLAVDWHRITVSEEPLPESNQCLHAEALGALPVEAGSKKARLLDCALSAPTNEKRMCCVDTLVELGASCDQLAEEVDARVLVDSGSAGTLLALSEGEETLSRELDEVARRLNLSCEAMQLVGLQLACASLGRGGENSTAVLDWLFEENNGCMSPEDREDDTDPHEVCDTLTEGLRSGGDADDAAICQARREVIAERNARLEQLRGPSAEESAMLAGQIARGGAQSDGRNNTLDQFVASLQGKAGAPNVESYTDADKKRIMEHMQKNAMTPEEAMAIPGDALNNVQEKYEAIKGKEKLQTALEEAGETPSEDFDDKVEEARGKFDQVSKRVEGEKAKAESAQDRKRPAQNDRAPNAPSQP
ncbi:MAG: hypothetical protein ACOC9W_03370 [Persicimonas sp.]